MQSIKKKNSKRKFVKAALASIFGMSMASRVFAQGSHAKLIASRMYSSATHTRVTFETDTKLEYKYFFLENPLRLVVDMTGIEIVDNLKELTDKATSDQYLSGLKLGINRPNVTRLVFALKEKVKPQIFNLDPQDNSNYRLVMDIYPEIDSEVLFAQLANEKLEEKKSKLETNKKIYVVAIDAGHGGADPGAIGASGTYEKTITLAVALRLKEKIDQIPWMQAVLTRNGDYFIPLHQRVERANKARADVFLSIHADAVERREAKGSSVYVLSEKGASSTTTKWLEQKENAADAFGGEILKNKEDSVTRTLFDLSLTGTMMESSKLASSILNEMGKINYLHKKNVESAGFAVLKSPSIPSVLIETAFISNPEEERKLKDPAHQEKIVDAIIAGVTKHMTKYGNH